MENIYTRTRMLVGDDGIERLAAANVAVFGLGGVGSYALEALARAGVGRLILVDGDVVAPSNVNRQLIATESTVGMRKTDVAAARVREINPSAKVETYDLFYSAETADEVPLSGVDFAVDAIDTVKSKLEIIKRCDALGVGLISCMGTGNKLDPTRLEIADIYKTSVCPLAREMRRLCRREGIAALKVLYSKEEPRRPIVSDAEGDKGESDAALPQISKRCPPGSISFVPSVAGLIIAGEIIRTITGV